MTKPTATDSTLAAYLEGLCRARDIMLERSPQPDNWAKLLGEIKKIAKLDEDIKADASFADAPVSIAAARAHKSDDSQIYAPRDALVDELRNIDQGKVAPMRLVVATQVGTEEDWRVEFRIAGCRGVEAIGLFALAQIELSLGMRRCDHG